MIHYRRILELQDEGISLRSAIAKEFAKSKGHYILTLERYIHFKKKELSHQDEPQYYRFS